jgi:hypothetical protein
MCLRIDYLEHVGFRSLLQGDAGQLPCPAYCPAPMKADNDRELGSTTDELAMNMRVQSSKDR